MTGKTKKFLSAIKRLQISNPENIEYIIKLVDENQMITFFSWKMFDMANPSFDPILADRFIDKEKKFIDILLNLNIKFEYIKLIPDELPKVFYSKEMNLQALSFANQVEIYFKKIYSGTKVFRITQILDQKTYDLVYRQSIKSNIDPDKLENEILFRQNKEIGLKAFGLFAAETAILFKYFKNPVLLAGVRSVDTYKYEFFKYPKNRPVLPKLFVL